MQDLSWLNDLPPESLKFVRGIEKEGLRVKPDGRISQKNHPVGLGSALTHPSITTDYSEALLEFITPALDNSSDLFKYLKELHQFTYSKLPSSEFIWPGSMPAIIDNELDIRIAEYGNSNIGRLKHIYRHGLWHRYGRIMQSIAGMHFNFSMPKSFWSHFHQQQKSKLSIQDFQSESYFRMIRNFRRHSWLLMYLFGASPAIDRSFLDSDSGLKTAGSRSKYLPFATSLRMSDVGYTNKAQEALNVSFNGIDPYISSLRKAIHQVHQPYKEMGLKNGDEFIQINSNILQIENEYYSDVRPKRVADSGEKPVCALSRRGVEYIEVRCMDLDPFEPLGIAPDTLHFLEVFLVWCLFENSDPIDTEEDHRLKENLKLVVHDGFAPDLHLTDREGPKPISLMINERLEAISSLAAVIDEVKSTNNYSQSVLSAKHKADNPDTIASNKMRKLLEEGKDYSEIMLELAEQHKTFFEKQNLGTERLNEFDQLAIKSILQQEELESSQQVPFDEFIEEFQHQDDKYCDQ